MRIQQPGQARAYPFDRNATHVGTAAFLTGSLAPHALTQRATYTVPAGRKAQVMSRAAGMVRITVAAPVSTFRIDEQVQAATRSLLVSFDNNVGGHVEHAQGQNTQLLAGEQIQLFTIDGSTGGTVLYYGHVDILEFDA